MTRPTPVPASPEGAAPPASGRSAWRYRPELDGLRTFAVVVIVFFHAQVAGASSSFIVLDLFFVLSGFLVTNVVLSEVDASGRFRLGRYYARRVRRLLPAAVVTIVVTSVVFVMVASKPERLELVRQAQAALVYLANWQFIADGADYFAGDIRDSPFMHFWSLSIEEQYYIVFPLLLLLWLKLAPGKARVLLAGLGVLTALSVASQVYWGQVDPTRAYFATDARLFQLLAGAMLAVALREFATPAAEGGVRWRHGGRILAVVGLLGYVVLGSELIDMSVSHRNLIATLLAGALVLGTYTAPGSLVARGFALPWMIYLGKISYGIYLWHYPVLLVLGRVFDVRPSLLAVMALVGAIALASMSYQMLETPIRRGKVLDPFPWPTVTAGVALSVAAAVVVVPPLLTSERKPSVVAASGTTTAEVVTDDVVRQLETSVPRNLDFQSISKDRGPGDSLCTPSAPDDCTVVDGDGPHVVLIGDSHARMLSSGFKQLARDEGFRLSLSVVPSCPWQDGLLNASVTPDNLQKCRDARGGFYRRTLPKMDADVVVLANLPRSDASWQGKITDWSGHRGKLDEMQKDATERTVRLINDAGAKAVMIKSILGTGGWDKGGFDPLDCLARAKKQGDCVVTPPMERAEADGIYEVTAIGNDDAATIDLNPVICPDAPTCRPIIDGVVVWRDQRHITGAITKHLRREIWAAVKQTGFV